MTSIQALHRARPFVVPQKTLVGPVLYRQNGYAFDMFTVAAGLNRSFSYKTVEEAIYDRKTTLRGLSMVGCETTTEFDKECEAMMPEDVRLCA